MGGMVARSAIHHGALIARGNLRWPTRLDDVVCLGTPHQGTPLGRAGHGLEQLLSAAPYAAPLARLGKIRSAGINDLRIGNVVSGRVRDAAEDPDPSPGPAGRPTRRHALLRHRRESRCGWRRSECQ